MTELKRYQPLSYMPWAGDDGTGMVEHPRGLYVEAADYSAKCADYERLREALEKLEIPLDEFVGRGYDPIECPCTDSEHGGGDGGYLVVHMSVRGRPLRPCANHLPGYLRCGWFARKIAPPPAAPRATTSSDIVAARKAEESSSGGRK